jgi:15-cis-phytoene synthase
VTPKLLPEQIQLSADQQLCLAYARAETRNLLTALFRVDATLRRVALGAREPMMARIKLAWWREQGVERGAGDLGREIESLNSATDQSLPLLCQIAEGWDAFLAADGNTDAALSNYASGRGGGLFELGAAALGTVFTPELERAGKGWALTDLAFALKDHALAPPCLTLARATFLPRLPRGPLPLTILALLAMSDVERGINGAWRAGSPMRMARAAAFALTGR